MSKDVQGTPEEFIEWLKSLTKEEITYINQMEYEQAEKDHREFVDAFNEGKCSLCGKPLNSFDDKISCLHWLLRPKGFKKKHFPLLYEKFNYFRISSYVRWVASLAGPLRNINDLKDLHPGKKIVDFTAKHNHITWSFSCSNTDYVGHENSTYGKEPHYHVQMKLNGKIFISYGDFHISFHKEDLFNFELLINHGDLVKHNYGRGSGLQSFVEHEGMLDSLVEYSTPAPDESQAPLHMSTVVMANEGEKISGDLIAEAMEEARVTNRTFASVIREKLGNEDASIVTMVSPGEGVPEPQQRKKSRVKKQP